jgi:dihydroneopterin triphosphate diphosphatase
MTHSSRFKRPESILAVVHTRAGNVLLLKRADLPEFWQSITGALRWDETDPRQTALREIEEETGICARPEALRDLGVIRCFPILPQFRGRYDPEVSHNIEHAFAFELPGEVDIRLSTEHTDYGWFPAEEAMNKAASWTDRESIQALFTK